MNIYVYIVEEYSAVCTSKVNLKDMGLNFEYLSMGMSNDYKIAVKNGSNMIRLGRTIFCERNYGGNNGNI